MLRGAVVVALLSQLSQQCGAALVRVRDEVSRSTSFSRVVARRALVPSRVVAQTSAHTAWARQQSSLHQTCGVEAKSRSRTDSRPSHRGAAETREKQIPILGGARAKP